MEAPLLASCHRTALVFYDFFEASEEAQGAG